MQILSPFIACKFLLTQINSYETTHNNSTEKLGRSSRKLRGGVERKVAGKRRQVARSCRYELQAAAETRLFRMQPALSVPRQTKFVFYMLMFLNSQF